MGHMLKPLVPKFRFNLSVLKRAHIAEKQVPSKLKPIVDSVWYANYPVSLHTALAVCVLQTSPAVCLLPESAYCP